MTVTDTFEANNDPAGPLTGLATSSFYLSYVTGADDVDFFSYPVPAVAGTRVTFNLSHLEFDADLVVYGPYGQMLRDERPGTEPLDGQPLDDDGPKLTSEADALEQQTLSDLALANLPVLGVATLRGTEDDAVTVVSDGTPGNYVIQVTGFNGGSSAEPYMLRPEQRAPVALPSCQPRTFANTGTNSTSLTRGTVPAVVDTVFVVNKAQWERVHGTAAVDAGADVAGRPDGGSGGRRPPERDPAGRRRPGRPGGRRDLERVPDGAHARERCHARDRPGDRRLPRRARRCGLELDRPEHRPARRRRGDPGRASRGPDDGRQRGRLRGDVRVGQRALDHAPVQGYFLSDDPYGDVDPIPFFDRQLHIPDVPGRAPADDAGRRRRARSSASRPSTAGSRPSRPRRAATTSSPTARSRSMRPCARSPASPASTRRG